MSNFGINELIEKIISGRLEEEIFTALPAIVEDVSLLATEQSIIVQPAINREYNPDYILQSPLIFKVPVVFPAGGGGVLTFPIQKGDTVLVVFSKRSIDDWLLTDGSKTVTPKRKRVFSLSDAIAIPGLVPIANNHAPNPTDVELKFKGMSIKLTGAGDIDLANGPAGSSTVLDSSGNVTLANGAGSVTLASSGIVTLSNAGGNIVLNVDGSISFGNGASITASGDFASASGKSMNDHVHSQANDNAGDIQQNTSTAI